MMSIDEIIAQKIATRCCRRQLEKSKNILEIVKECCEDLRIAIPKLICCETLFRNFSAFHLREKPYLIYDSCLAETLYLYDYIVFTGKKRSDLDKLFYKLIGEELLRQDDLAHCMYFAGKYQQSKFSFEEKNQPSEMMRLISKQSYFLIAHELTHLSLHPKGYDEIPEEYKKFVYISVKKLTEHAVKENSVEHFLEERYKYFLDELPATLEEYYERLRDSRRFYHFIEECYCDFRGIKLLMEHYENAEESIEAVSIAMNYLIVQEAIRDDLEDGILYMSDSKLTASMSMYLSVLRMEMLLVTLQFSGLKDIEHVFYRIQGDIELTNYLKTFVSTLPTKNSFDKITEVDLPNIERKNIASFLMQQFYFIHFS